MPAEPAQPLSAPGSVLRLFVLPGVSAEAAEARLGRRAAPDVAPLPFTAEALTAALDVNATPLVVFRSGEIALTAAMASGTPPSAALQDWCETVSALLQVQRRHRRRVLLVEEELFLSGEAAALQGLFDRLGRPVTEPAASAPEPGDPLHLALALHILAATPRALALAGEMEAASPPRPARSLAPDAIDAAFRQQQEAEAARADDSAARLGQMLSDAQSRIRALEDEHGRLIIQMGEARTAHLGQSARIATQEQELAALQARLADSQAAGQGEHALLLAHLEQVQREADTQATRATDLHSQLQAQIKAKADLEARLRGELKAAAEAQTRQQEEAARELRVQAERLTQVIDEGQAALQLARKSAALLEQETQSMLAQNAALRREIRDTRAQGAEMQKQVQDRETGLTARIAEMEAERHKILSSHSWRVTTPLRAVNSMLGGIASRRS